MIKNILTTISILFLSISIGSACSESSFSGSSDKSAKKEPNRNDSADGTSTNGYKDENPNHNPTPYSNPDSSNSLDPNGLDDSTNSDKDIADDDSGTNNGSETPTTKQVQGTVHGYRFEFPCPGASGYSMGCSTPKWDAQNANRKFGGDPEKSYKVTLHVRGVVESMTYSGGNTPTEYESLDGSKRTYFYIGGRPTNPSYNWFAMSVGEPSQTYYFNKTGTTEMFSFILNYKTSIIIKGGTQVKFEFEENDKKMAGNARNLKVPGVEPYPKAYPGQFIQVDVINAVPID